MIKLSHVIAPLLVSLGSLAAGMRMHGSGVSRPGYVLTDLGAVDGSNSSAYAINDSGLVVGLAQRSRPTVSARAFVWHSGTRKVLEAPTGTLSATFTQQTQTINP